MTIWDELDALFIARDERMRRKGYTHKARVWVERKDCWRNVYFKHRPARADLKLIPTVSLGEGFTITKLKGPKR